MKKCLSLKLFLFIKKRRKHIFLQSIIFDLFAQLFHENCSKISEYHWYCFIKSKAVCKRWTEVKSAVGIIFSRCWVFCLGILNFDINIWFKTLLCQCRSLQTNVPILVGDILFELSIVQSFLERFLSFF